MIAVINAGPLIALGKLGLVDLLAALYGVVLVPPTVYAEVVIQGTEVGATDALEVRRAVLRLDLLLLTADDVRLTDEVASLPLDAGEIEVIQVALDRSADIVLLDDQLARQHAGQRGLAVKGTIGVLVHAVRAQLMTLDELRAVFDSIVARDDIWIGEGLMRQVLDQLQREAMTDR